MALFQKMTEEQTEQMIGNLLRAGVLFSASVVFTGGVLYLLRYGNQPADYRIFHGVPGELESISGIFHSAFSFHRRGLIQLGVLALIATPIARVLLALYTFLLQRDWLYLLITSVVSAVLLFSLLRP